MAGWIINAAMGVTAGLAVLLLIGVLLPRREPEGE